MFTKLVVILNDYKIYNCPIPNQVSTHDMILFLITPVMKLSWNKWANLSKSRTQNICWKLNIYKQRKKKYCHTPSHFTTNCTRSCKSNFMATQQQQLQFWFQPLTITFSALYGDYPRPDQIKDLHNMFNVEIVVLEGESQFKSHFNKYVRHVRERSIIT